jgi:hypothetical protein
MPDHKTAMPPEVRLFFWGAIAIAAVWLFTIATSFREGLAILEKVPQDVRASAQTSEIIHAIMTALVWDGAVLTSAWLAVFRCKAWARYVFAGVVLARMGIPIGV